MNHALRISISDPDPRFLNYPSFLLYSIAVVNGALTRLGLVTEPWQSYVLGRSIVAVFGTLTCAATFFLAEELGGGLTAAALAGLWTALLPLHVWESHIAVTDVVMTFWIVVTLLASVRLLRAGRDRDFLLAGAALGLAVGAKYTAALALVAPVVAAVAARRPAAKTVRGLLLVAAAGAVACALVTPYSFYHFGELRRALAREFAHLHGHQPGFSLPAAGPQYHKYVYQIAAAFPFSMGIALFASAAVGAAWMLTRLRAASAVVISFALVFFAVTGSWTFTPLRYYLPLPVLGALAAGLWQGTWLVAGSRRQRALAAVAGLLTLGYTGVFTLQTTARFRDDTRMQAARWLDEALPPGGKVLLCGWLPYLARPLGPARSWVARNETVIGQLEKYTDFPLIELSSLHYLRWYRHGHPGLLPAYERIRRGRGRLRLVKRFEADFLNRDLYRRLDPMFEGYFLSPTLEFYAWKNGL